MIFSNLDRQIRLPIITDRVALKWLLSSTNLNGKLRRWALLLQEMEFVIEYRPGKMNVVSDALSRVSAVILTATGRWLQRRQLQSVNAEPEVKTRMCLCNDVRPTETNTAAVAAVVGATRQEQENTTLISDAVLRKRRKMPTPESTMVKQKPTPQTTATNPASTSTEVKRRSHPAYYGAEEMTLQLTDETIIVAQSGSRQVQMMLTNGTYKTRR
ncbi:Retrotransposon Polyprotein [Phytophthora megakarya]|uniref:Retrotransposon Polyprotein n=1 Tax=Phytophthora megakarya TaxID=4795 RepID=A0A225WPX6_9STRA|nr:Retrotransposon Polyprotein [Phytophthora megakarya]